MVIMYLSKKILLTSPKQKISFNNETIYTTQNLIRVTVHDHGKLYLSRIFMLSLTPMSSFKHLEQISLC